MAGAMGLLHRKEAGELGQITKDFTCSAEAKGWGVHPKGRIINCLSAPLGVVQGQGDGRTSKG